MAINGHRKAFHDQMKVRMTLVAIADFDKGQQDAGDDAPFAEAVDPAASISEGGTASARLEDEDADDGREQRQGDAQPVSSTPSHDVIR